MRPPEMSPRIKAVSTAIVLFVLGALSGVAADRWWIDRTLPAPATGQLTAASMAKALDLNSAQQARVVELLEDLEVRVTQAALEGPASLQEAARDARRLLEEEIPPDRRERFRNWMGEHRDWMMNEMCDEEMMRSNWRGEQDWNRWRRSED